MYNYILEMYVLYIYRYYNKIYSADFNPCQIKSPLNNPKMLIWTPLNTLSLLIYYLFEMIHELHLKIVRMPTFGKNKIK